MRKTELTEASPTWDTAQIVAELWVSLASLIRAYIGLHELSGTRRAVVDWGEDRILARCGAHRLELRRTGAMIAWRREDGRSGTLELTEAGQLRGASGEEEMDMAAERWARELMQ